MESQAIQAEAIPREMMHAIYSAQSDGPASPENENQMQLKIFSGCHQGACVALQPGRYRIGSSHSCDLVLLNDGVLSEHAELIVEHGSCKIVPLAGEAFLNGTKVTADQAIIPLQGIFTLGKVHIGLTDSQSAWEPQALPTLIEDEAAAASEQTQDVPVQPVAVSKWKRLKLRLIILLLPVLGLPFIIVHLGFKPQAADKNLYSQEIKQLFQEMDCSEPSIIIDESGYMRVVGYVRNTLQKTEVIRKLDAFDRPMSYRIYAGDELADACNHYLVRMDLMVKAQYCDPGTIHLKGFLPTAADESLLVERCKQNISGIGSVSSSIFLLDRLMPAIADTLDQYKLAGNVTASPKDDHLLFSGTINSEQYLTWQQAKSGIIAKFGSELSIAEKMDVFDKALSAPGIINLPISGVTLGANPFITLKGGKICFKGAPLKGGMHLKDISPDRIVVELQGRDYFYDWSKETSLQGQSTPVDDLKKG